MSSPLILTGDCRWWMAHMAGPCDAIVTDPPYELGFMGKHWDRAGIAFDARTWRLCLALLKPGGRMLAFGAPRTHHRIWCAIEDAGFVIEDTVTWLFGQGFPKHKSKLKPAFEPICVARKGPVTPLNIDAGRIATGEGRWYRPVPEKPAPRMGVAYAQDKWTKEKMSIGAPVYGDANGRWPANVALDEEAARLLDAQSGTLTSGKQAAGGHRRNADKHRVVYAPFKGHTVEGDVLFGDSGGASRFFYCAKASRREREHGLEGMPMVKARSGIGGDMPVDDQGRDRERFSVVARNHHATVKPVDLMRWLVRLVTQPDDLVLDPFMGSGTTGMACVAEGRRFVGIEHEPEYVEIAKRRIAATQPSLFTP